MPTSPTVFANIEVESAVQVNDRTRLDASKTFIAKSGTALSALTVKPGADVSAISVFDSADASNQYLDWEFASFTGDIDETNNRLDFSVGGSLYAATLASGTYTLAQLATEIAAKMQVAYAGTFAAAYDVKDFLTISAAVNFELLPATGVNREKGCLPMIGFRKDRTGSTSYRGERTEWLSKAITVTGTNVAGTESKTVHTKLFSEAGDALFSSDGDLTFHEPDLLQYVQRGRNSFKNVHRRAQDLILAWLDKEGYVNLYDQKYQKKDIIDHEEVRQWSTFIALKLICEGISTEVDDVWYEKSKRYTGMEKEMRGRAILRIDIDQDEKIDINEGAVLSSGFVCRR